MRIDYYQECQPKMVELMVFGLFTYPKRLNELFSDAVNVWLVIGDPDALEIAANAVLTAAQRQRESMIHYAATSVEPVELIFGATGTVPTSVSGNETVDLDKVKLRLKILLSTIQNLQNVSLMQARKEMKRENEQAVQKGDAKFFRSQYPDFPMWN